ncbi:MAG: cation transporter [Rickettsiales bacterium]|jgi:Co/Zn/Cd efflux system component
MSHEHGHNHDHVIDDRKILWIVLALNFAMFFIELWQGMKADSTALIADSMDFLSDSFSYGITLYVIQKHLHTRAKAALIKAALMLLLAIGALTQGAHNLLEQTTPAYMTMGWVATLALLVNSISALLLYKSRGRDSNMQSVWLCSRNDMITNILIIIAAFLVFASNSLFPDLLVALGIAWLEGSSAIKIIRHAKQELRS